MVAGQMTNLGEKVRAFLVPFLFTLVSAYSAGILLLWVKMTNINPETDTFGDAGDAAAAIWVYWIVFGLVVASFPALLTGISALILRQGSHRPGLWTACVGLFSVATLSAALWSF